MRVLLHLVAGPIFSLVPLAAYILIIDAVAHSQPVLSVPVIIALFIGCALVEWSLSLCAVFVRSKAFSEERRQWVSRLVVQIFERDAPAVERSGSWPPGQSRTHIQTATDALFCGLLLGVLFLLNMYAGLIGTAFLTTAFLWNTVCTVLYRHRLQTGLVAEREHFSLPRQLRFNALSLRLRLEKGMVEKIFLELERQLFSKRRGRRLVMSQMEVSSQLLHRLHAAGLLFLCAYLVSIHQLSMGGLFGCNIAFMRLHRPAFNFLRDLRTVLQESGGYAFFLFKNGKGGVSASSLVPVCRLEELEKLKFD
jgi:hypothetical protein